MALINVAPLTDGIITAAQLNTILTTFKTDYNGNITDANFALNADIDGLKLQDASVTSRKYKPICGEGVATAQLNLSTSWQDIVGATVTFTCDIASTVMVNAVFDIQGIASGSNVVFGRLVVDGTAYAGQISADSDAAAIRVTTRQGWSVNVEPGVHTFKLQAKTTADTGTEKCNTSHTKIIYYVISQ